MYLRYPSGMDVSKMISIFAKSENSLCEGGVRTELGREAEIRDHDLFSLALTPRSAQRPFQWVEEGPDALRS